MDENSAEDGPPNVARLVKAKAQCRLPEFRTYLAGRLGLMGSKAAERRGAGGPSTFD
jgi:hypothetical protein